MMCPTINEVSDCLRKKICVAVMLRSNSIDTCFDHVQGYIFRTLVHIRGKILRHPREYICICVRTPWPIFYIEVEVSQLSNPPMTCRIQSSCGQHVRERVVVSVYSEMRTIIEIVTKMLTDCPFQC